MTPTEALPILVYAVQTRISLDQRLRRRIADHLGMPRTTSARALARAFLSVSPDELTRICSIEAMRAGDARIRKAVAS